MYDTIIIGAGMSGLAAGIRLAYYDQRVCILERHYTIGGLNSFYRLGGRDYDVGLHAVTNFVPKGTRRGPLARMLRQLRFGWDEFALRPQVGSQIAFPQARLQFGNGLELLRSEIERAFPGQKQNFSRLLEKIVDYEQVDQASLEVSARQVVGETISDPLLAEMLFCPLMWYGNARERDMDFGQFCIMFRSIFMEGFARPFAGVRLILKKLIRKYRELGGELKLRSGVQRIVKDHGRAAGVVLDGGRELEARRIISSAGYAETLRMCGDSERIRPGEVGQLSFVETISILNRPPAELGCDKAIVFFNDSEKFHWEKPQNAACDVRTGVICSPNNYCYEPEEGELPDGVIRITALANFGRWKEFPEEEYRREKRQWYDRLAASAARFVPDFRPAVMDIDMFTPKTIHRYTWHENGAVYGATRKRLDGRTHVDNLYLCGTDQGFVGIVGAMTSGIAIANHCLTAGATESLKI